MILHIIMVDLLNGVVFPLALLPPTVRYFSMKAGPERDPIWTSMNYPVQVKFPIGVWG
jgi:hypothetical protein